MNDLFHNQISGLQSPATRLATVKPNDVDDLAFSSRAIAVGTEGFVHLTTVAGDTGTIFVVPGAPFPVRARRIWASGTTAADIVVLA